MPRFMLILRGDPRDWTDLSPSDMQRIMGRYLAWGDELRAQGRRGARSAGTNCNRPVVRN